jgi:rubrerythrin
MAEKPMKDDNPSCPFLKENIAAEKAAIESYSKEASRTDDLVWKRAIRSISIDEMQHLEVLESISKKIGCEK